MPRPKKDKVLVSGDTKAKSMILSLDPTIHNWVKNIATQTGKSQPKIIQLVLAKESTKSPDNYIQQIQEVEKKARAEQLKQQMQAMSDELKQLEGD